MGGDAVLLRRLRGERLARLRAGLGAAAIAFGLGASPATAAPPPLDLAIKAAYLTKFPPFVDWPAGAFAGPDSPLTICVLAGDPLAPLVGQAASGQMDGSRPIAVRQLAPAEAPDGCQVFYFEPDNPAAVEMAQSLQKRPVLTVTSAGNDLPVHPTIVFVIDDKRMRFDVDEPAAAQSGLTISSNLLALARNVKRAP